MGNTLLRTRQAVNTKTIFMSVLTTTRVSAPEPNADSHTNVANVQDQAIQQQTAEGDQLQQLI